MTIAYDRTRPTEESFRYVSCSSCGLARQQPLPAPDVISSFYPDDYAPHHGRKKKRRERWINRVARRYWYSTDSVHQPGWARAVGRLVALRVMPGTRPPHGQNRLLDVGCGSGDLLARYRDLGWTTRGVEINPRGCATARERGLEVHQGTIHDAPFSSASFDMLVLSHVIEHVADPHGFLTACAKFLAPGGVLLLSTPNLRGYGFSLYRSCWYHLDAPRHLLLFEPRSMRLLAERTGLGVRRLVTRSDVRCLCNSRHYARTQGALLPDEIERRRAVLAESRRNTARQPLFKQLVRPLAAFGTLVGRGEVIEAELTVGAN